MRSEAVEEGDSPVKGRDMEDHQIFGKKVENMEKPNLNYPAPPITNSKGNALLDGYDGLGGVQTENKSPNRERTYLQPKYSQHKLNNYNRKFNHSFGISGCNLPVNTAGLKSGSPLPLQADSKLKKKLDRTFGIALNMHNKKSKIMATSPN